MNAIRIVVIALVIVLLWIIWGYFTSSAGVSLLQLSDANIGSIIPKAPSSSTLENWAYSVWISIDTWEPSAANRKIIEVSGEGTSSGTNAFELLLDGTKNELIVNIGTNNGTRKCEISNIPLQKWTHIIVSLDGKAVSIYKDGKIESVCTLDADMTPVNHSGTITISGGSNGNGFKGFLAKLTKYPNSVSPQEAWGYYKEGHGASGLLGFLSEYGFKMAVTKGGQDWTKVEI